MITKEQIFDNVGEYNAKELVDFIKKGEVTFDELCDYNNTLGDFKPKIRREVEELLKNAEPNDWAEAKKANTIDAYQKYLDSYPEGEHRDEARKFKRILEDRLNEDRIEEEKRKKAEREMAARAAAQEGWNRVKKGSKHELESYIRNNQSSPFVKDAEALLADIENGEYTCYGMEALKNEIRNISSGNTKTADPNGAILEKIKNSLDNNWIDIDDILDEIEDDYNFLNAWVVKKLVKERYFTYRDLEDLGISRSFIQKMANDVEKTRFDSPGPLNQISRLSTEIYFWGIPSSGKSCALGSILSMAGTGEIARTMIKDTSCQGFDYMTRLPLCFNEEGSVSVLPEGTPTLATYEMGFDLIDADDKVHPITCIDFAGELMTCIYKEYANRPLTNQQREALDSLKCVLGDTKSDNRKIHFFVVEYGADGRTYDGIPQKEYLNTVVNYIDRENIFKTSTDAIYLIVTKVDKIKARNGEERMAKLKDYITKQYGGFYNGLTAICKKYQINGGKISILPFSLGKVCFQDYCIMKDVYAKNVVEIILSRSHKFNLGRKGTFESFFRG